MEEKAKNTPMAIEPKHIPKKFLSSDENLVFESRQSAWFRMKSAALYLIIEAVALVLFIWPWMTGVADIPYVSDWLADPDYGDYVQMAFGALFFLAFILSSYKWWIWSNTVYAVTDERVITQTRKWLAKTYRFIPVTQIEDVRLVHPVSGRILRYGTIEISTGSLEAGKADITWLAVPSPMTVSRILEEVMDVRDKPV